MITIYVGNTKSEVIVDFTDTDIPLLPKGVASYFRGILHMASDDWSIRVYTPTVINLIGDMIEEGTFSRYQVCVVADGVEFGFDAKGSLQGCWPHGIFNY